MVRSLLATAVATLISGAALAASIASSVDPATLPKSKTTSLGLYLSPKDAAAALAADPSIVFLDVRDPIEVAFVGQAEGVDANVPVATFTHRFDPKANDYAPAQNPNFVAEAEAVLARLGRAKTDPVFVICRSGGRSAAAAEKLAKAGFANVWNLAEGFEGDLNKETGERTLNGWRNAGLPWTYRMSAETAWSAPAR
jgi:rhodanese-related sulfurtransferase